tara:strand:+ start:423 stop:686 length:264 start_codon:yes stop_codon:yes gene_type:complete
VLIKKLTAITDPANNPKENPAKAKNEDISVEITKQNMNKRGKINLRKLLEFSSSSVLNTVGEVTTMKETITPKSNPLSNIPASPNML